MGLISLAAIPSLKNITSSNKKRRFDYYVMSMENAARIYFRREEEDLLSNRGVLTLLNGNGLNVCNSQLIDLELLSDYDNTDTNYVCKGGVNISYKSGILTFKGFLKCKDGQWSNGEEIYNTGSNYNSSCE